MPPQASIIGAMPELRAGTTLQSQFRRKLWRAACSSERFPCCRFALRNTQAPRSDRLTACSTQPIRARSQARPRCTGARNCAGCSMSSPPRRLLITGGAGFIGANFVHHWRRAHPRDLIVVLDALTYAGNRANLRGIEADERFIFVHADIRNQELIEGELVRHALDTVVHFAAESHVDRSITGPDAFIET